MGEMYVGKISRSANISQHSARWLENSARSFERYVQLCCEYEIKKLKG